VIVRAMLTTRLLGVPRGWPFAFEANRTESTGVSLYVPRFDCWRSGNLDGYKPWTRRMQVTKPEQTLNIEMSPIPR